MAFSMKDYFELQFRQKARNYGELNKSAVKGATVLAGSSLMENFPIYEIMLTRGDRRTVYNRGISAMTIADYRKVLDKVILELEPGKLLINIGSNDLNLPGDTIGNLIAGYRELLQTVIAALPHCRITLLAYYPCIRPDGTAHAAEGRIVRTIENIHEANRAVEALAQELGLGYLDLNDAVSTAEGWLDPEIALDDIHFSPAGYERVYDLLKEYL